MRECSRRSLWDEVKQLKGIDKVNFSDKTEDEDAAISKRDERIILVAEEFEYEVFVAAEWLRDKDVDIKCIRVKLAADDVHRDAAERSEYATFSTVFPAPEIEREFRKRKEKKIEELGDWEQVWKDNGSEAAKFFNKELANKRENARS
jgi:hypothetical protein